jgi:hypothetical protein
VSTCLVPVSNSILALSFLSCDSHVFVFSSLLILREEGLIVQYRESKYVRPCLRVFLVDQMNWEGKKHLLIKHLSTSIRWCVETSKDKMISTRNVQYHQGQAFDPAAAAD